MKYYLGIDIGASSGRHILGHVEDGKVVLEEIYRFYNGVSDVNGHLCWDLKQLFAEIKNGMKECAKQDKIPASLGIDTWGVDFVLLDEPLGALDLKLRKDMQLELKKIQQQVGITFVYVTHDQEEALTMSDTIVVMDKGCIQQIGTPEDIYNEPKNAFVADFIGESNIIDGVMVRDKLVKMYGREFPCLDGGFAPGEPVDVVIRPEDIDIVPVDQGQLVGTVTSVTFKGMQYDIIVDFRGFKWLIQTTDHSPVGARIGVKIDPDGFHIMKKSQYSGMFGDYSSYSDEYDELSDAEALDDGEDEGAEEERREEGYAE